MKNFKEYAINLSFPIVVCLGGFLLLIAFCDHMRAVADELQEAKRIAPSYKAEVEVVQWDLSRIDLLTPEYAIEVDWAPKWAEAVGQCLYYEILCDQKGLERKPAIVLLIKDKQKEARYIYRCQTVCARHNIRLFVEQVDETAVQLWNEKAPPWSPNKFHENVSRVDQLSGNILDLHEGE